MSENQNMFNETETFKNELNRYIVFWPYFIFSVIFLNLIGAIYLRYADYQYSSESKIEIIDKAQDSEMALPTTMTIFNRSMINLENEIGILMSYSLHERVVKNQLFNIEFSTIGKIKTSLNHSSEWFEDYQFELLISNDEITKNQNFSLEISGNMMIINSVLPDDSTTSYTFDNLSTYDVKHPLPFNLKINNVGNSFSGELKNISLNNFESTVKKFQNNVIVSKTDQNSDQLKLSLTYNNQKIADDYLNSLMTEFDLDGISDRQLEYKRTMDFVDSRSIFLKKELELVESRRQEFKEINNFTDLKSASEINYGQKISYDSEIFKVKNQLELLSILKNSILNIEKYDLMPVNIGIDDIAINDLLEKYNTIIKNRLRFIQSAGPNNSLIKNLEKQIIESKENLISSVDNYQTSLKLSLENLEMKENEFLEAFSNIPENEKILRSIERELEVKEALYLLLLQKREEASINYAVVKPSIKIIDNAMGFGGAISPKAVNIFLFCSLMGLFVPFGLLYILFFFDNKIHTRDNLKKIINDIPFMGEIPYVKDYINKFADIGSSRDVISESLRIIMSNILFTSTKNDCRITLVTSSIKGEGKTLVSTNIANVLSSKFEKVLLIGADLRNPQIHKYTEYDKSRLGLSDYIYREDLVIDELLIKNNKLDILLSGTIPPNPVELLSSDKFKNLIQTLKKKYDFIVIDSAPCLLVADTFQISDFADNTLYVVRANYTDKKVVDYVKESYSVGRLNNLQIVLNSVGSSSAYGYKYGYQYGYRYGYKYSYNYGYGYGYGADKT